MYDLAGRRLGATVGGLVALDDLIMDDLEFDYVDSTIDPPQQCSKTAAAR